MPGARWLRLSAVLTLLVLLYLLAPVSSQDRGGPLLRGLLAVAVLVALAAAVIVQIRLAASDASRHVDGLVAVIAAVCIVFAFVFFVLERHQSDQVAGLHTRLDALYFSASTMLTVGYGDVHASGQTARALVLVQLVFDAVFVATAATLLTSRLRGRAEQRLADQARSTHRNPT